MGLKSKIAGAALGGVMLMAVPFVAGLEGETNHAIIPVPGDVPTICFGHTKGVKMGDYLPSDICRELLEAEIQEYLEAVNAAVKVDIPDTMRVALVSFAYNVGINGFRNSSLLRKLNAGDLSGACYGMQAWVCGPAQPHDAVKTPGQRCYSRDKNKKVIQGLVNRRNNFEIPMCLEDL